VDFEESPQVAKSFDFICLFGSTLVTWGVAMVYVSHISTMTAAAGLENPSEGGMMNLGSILDCDD
jgi:hypothetical protein